MSRSSHFLDSEIMNKLLVLLPKNELENNSNTTQPYVSLKAVLGSFAVHPIYPLLIPIFNNAYCNFLSTKMTLKLPWSFWHYVCLSVLLLLRMI